jgi:hypothetical protein
MNSTRTTSPRRSLAARFSALIALALLAMVVPSLATTITVNVGRPSKSCTGFGICSITIDFAGTARSVPANAVIDGNRMMLQFAQTPADKGEFLVVEEDVVMDAATSLRLGYKQVTVKKGTYPVSYANNPNGTVGVDVQTSGIVIKVKLGRPSQNCTGFGICEISINLLSAERVVNGVAALNGDVLDLDLLGTTADKGDVLTIDEDITLDPQTARSLGAQQVVMRKGQYHVDYTKNPNGHVEIPVARIGIYVEISVGRRSRGCEGFGICDITVGVDFAKMNQVPAIAVVRNGKLSLDLTKSTGFQETTLPIDEDIVLDDATSHALGYKQVTVKKGTYQVDYSRNPNGSVDLDVAARGIVVTIYIGRFSQGCSGFGFCGIVIESAVADRAVKGALSLDGDMLSVDLLGAAPDRKDVLTIDEDIELDPAIARSLGAQRLVIRKGEYSVDYTKNPNGHVEIPAMRIGVTIYVEAGRRSKGCTGFGICSITVGFDFSERTVGSSASIDSDVMTIDFLKNLPEHGDVLTIDEDIVLDDAPALVLGYQSVVVKKGEYQVDYSSNPNGRVKVSVQTSGIGITIKVGRVSGGCVRGFGICIIIDTWLTTATDRDVRGTASIRGDMFSLDFLGTAPEHGDVLTLEEDVVLDDATARHFGYQHLTLRKGEYKVDYTKNPNGHVEIPVAKIGIGVTITLGRASRDCDGGGICKVRLSLDFARMHNDAPGVASVKGGKLVMDLLKQDGTHYDMLPIDQDIVLDSATSQALGYAQVTIKKGVYAVDYSSNPNGHVEVDIATRGIVVTIYVGRSSRGCTGFGICGIVIEASMERNAMRAVATFEDGKMRVQFLGQTETHGDTLVVEEDIVLSDEIAQALGLSSNMIRKGDYPVDYSNNTYGTFRLDTPTENTASVTSVNSTTSEALALTVAPNPTIGKAMLSFTLPQSEHVTVTLTDARGTQMATLMNDEPRSAGRHTISFDGSSLPAGTYFYTVHAGSMTETYRMQIVR